MVLSTKSTYSSAGFFKINWISAGIGGPLEDVLDGLKKTREKLLSFTTPNAPIKNTEI